MELSKLENNVLFECITGSRAYGTNTPESDIDIRGIVFSPKEYVYGIEKFETFEGFKNEDKVLYELRFAFRLMSDCNPNMIDILYVPTRCWNKMNIKLWCKILENRDIFLSKKAKYTYSGYAVSQLKRIETHRKWLFNPINTKPLRKDFGLHESYSNIPQDQLKAILNINKEFINEKYREEAIKEKQYHEKLNEYKSYMIWKENRNKKRALLEAKVGYDVKHAYALIRLYRMGKEILSTGKVNVDRTKIDADYLIAIKTGQIPWKNIIDEISMIEIELDKLYNTSSLQNTPNRNKINNLTIELYENFYEK